MPKKTSKKLKAPVKTEVDMITDTPVIVPPVFAGGMTENGAVEYLKEKIRMHREMNRKVAWTEEDLYIRHQLIINWLSTGRSTVDVARDMRNIWGIADSTARLFISEALEYLTASTDKYRDKAREVQIARLERYMEECRLMGKYLEASKFADQIAKLTGTYQDNKKLEIKSDKPIQISFGE